MRPASWEEEELLQVLPRELHPGRRNYCHENCILGGGGTTAGTSMRTASWEEELLPQELHPGRRRNYCRYCHENCILGGGGTTAGTSMRNNNKIY